jgi:hypothetical protein
MMYVLEYLIYHLQPFAVDSTSIAAFGSEDAPLVEKAYAMAILNMGTDDVFKKNLTHLPYLLNNTVS